MELNRMSDPASEKAATVGATSLLGLGVMAMIGVTSNHPFRNPVFVLVCIGFCLLLVLSLIAYFRPRGRSGATAIIVATLFTLIFPWLTFSWAYRNFEGIRFILICVLAGVMAVVSMGKGISLARQTYRRR